MRETTSVDFWCGFASVGMLPAVYCGLESSALPYSRTGQKPANETGLQGGVTYRPCWCFRLFQRTLPKIRWGCYHEAECHSSCITVHHLEGMKESGRWRGEGESGREGEKAYTLSYTRWWIAPWYRLSKWFRELKSSPQFGDYSVRRQHKTCSVKKQRPVWVFLTPVYAPEWPSTVSQSTCSPSSRAR